MIRFPLDHPHRDGGIILARQRKAQRLVELTDARRPRRAGSLRSPGRTWNRRHTRSPHSGARAAFRALLHRRKHHSPALRALRRAPVVQCRRSETHSRKPLFPRLYRARRLSENHAEPDEITARTKAAWAFSPDLRRGLRSRRYEARRPGNDARTSAARHEPLFPRTSRTHR